MGAVASVRVKCSGFTSQPNNKAYDDVLNCNRNHHSRKKSIKKCSFYIETIIQVHEFFFRSSRWDGEKKRAESALVWGEMVAFSRDNYFRWSDGEEMRRLTCVSRLVLVLFWSFREHFVLQRHRLIESWKFRADNTERVTQGDFATCLCPCQGHFKRHWINCELIRWGVFSSCFRRFCFQSMPLKKVRKVLRNWRDWKRFLHRAAHAVSGWLNNHDGWRNETKVFSFF